MFVKLLLIAQFLVVIPVFATDPALLYRTYTGAQGNYVSDPSGQLLQWRSDSRNLRSISFSDSLDKDSIVDISENSGTLWVLALSGLFMMDMSTGTSEHIVYQGPRSIQSKVTLDDDFGWLVESETLHKFDKLSREWMAYDLPDKLKENPIHGIYSDGTNIYCFTISSTGIFSIANEKWTVWPNKAGAVSATSTMYLDRNSVVFVDDMQISRYIISSQLWDIIPSTEQIHDVLLQDTAIYLLTNKGALQYDTRTGVTKVLDIPGSKNAFCFTRKNDTLVIATALNFIKYDLVGKNIETIDVPLQGPNSGTVLKICSFSNILTCLYRDQCTIRDPVANVWETSSFDNSQKRRKTMTWDQENNLNLRFSQNVRSQLKGNIQQEFKADLKDSTIIVVVDSTPTPYGYKYTHDTLYDTTLYYGNTQPDINLILHTGLGNDRFVDARLNNINHNRPAERWLYYRGARQDRIASARAGTASTQASEMQTIPRTNFEGLGAEIESARFLSTRDRKVIRSQWGAGLLTTHMKTEVLLFSETGLYTLKGVARDTSGKVIFVPGSLVLTIDGEEIDSMEYSFSPLTGDIQFKRQDITDPTSVIMARYAVESTPDRVKNEVEIIPQNHFGEMEYGSLTYSPGDWLSARANVLTAKPAGLSNDTSGRFVVSALSLPIEFRKQTPDLFIQLEPEIAYESMHKGLAGGLALQTRFFKRAGIAFSTLMADTNFKSTEVLTQGYGVTKQKYSTILTYDVLPEIPIKYSQYNGIYQFGKENRYELSTGAHFQGIPYFDASFSHNALSGKSTMFIQKDSIVQDSLTPGIYDTMSVYRDSILNLNRIKQRVRIKLYENTSPVLEKLFHISRLSYQTAWTGFISEKENDSTRGKGWILYTASTISPLQSMSASGSFTIWDNPHGSLYKKQYNPTLTLQTFDAPHGIDFLTRYSIDYKLEDKKDNAASTTERMAQVTLRPGAWVRQLSWTTLHFGLSQKIECAFDSLGPSFLDQIQGTKTTENHIWVPNMFLDSLSNVIFDSVQKNVSINHITQKLTSPTAEVDFAPFDNLTLRHLFKWTRVDTAVTDTVYPFDTVDIYNQATYRTFHEKSFWGPWLSGKQMFMFYMFHDIKWFCGQGKMLQTRLEYDMDPTVPVSQQIINRGYLRGFLRFESAWLPWLKTTTALSSSVRTFTTPPPNRSEITETITRTGPEIAVIFSLSKKGFIKSFISSNSINVAYENRDGRTAPHPDVGYTFYLKTIVQPNIYMTTNHSLSTSYGQIASYKGNLVMGLLF